MEQDIEINTYKHLYHRRDYLLENGYRMEAFNLPDWIYVTITHDRNKSNKYLAVYSMIHMNKKVNVGPCYSVEFTDKEILQDLSADVYSRFIK